MGYTRSSIRDFESYPRVLVRLDGDDFQFILKQKNSNFVTYDFLRGVYSFEDISKAVNTMGDHKGTLQIEKDDVIMKTKIVLTRFGGTFGLL